MSEFIRLYRKRVDEALKPHREVYGDEAPVVRMGLRLLAEAEDLERTLEERRVGTQEASRLTGWSTDTLQANARRVLDGEDLPSGWEDLVVEKKGAGYVFVLGTIPEHLSRAS